MRVVGVFSPVGAVEALAGAYGRTADEAVGSGNAFFARLEAVPIGVVAASEVAALVGNVEVPAYDFVSLVRVYCGAVDVGAGELAAVTFFEGYLGNCALYVHVSGGIGFSFSLRLLHGVGEVHESSHLGIGAVVRAACYGSEGSVVHKEACAVELACAAFYNVFLKGSYGFARHVYFVYRKLGSVVAVEGEQTVVVEHNVSVELGARSGAVFNLADDLRGGSDLCFVVLVHGHVELVGAVERGRSLVGSGEEHEGGVVHLVLSSETVVERVVGST